MKNSSLLVRRVPSKFRASCLLTLTLAHTFLPGVALACEPFIVGPPTCFESDLGGCIWEYCDDGTFGLISCDFGGGGGGGDPGDDDGCEGVNPLQVHDGNVRRRIDELSVGGAQGLSWKRFANSRARREVPRFPLGTAGGWRHGWQFDLVPVKDSRGLNDDALEFTYPSGHHCRLYATAGGVFLGEPGRREVGRRVAGGIEVETDDGSILVLSAKSEKAGSRYDPVSLTSPTGTRVDFTHDAAGRLTAVASGDGTVLNFAYTEFLTHNYVLRGVGSLTTGNSAGQWLEITVPVKERFSAQWVRAAFPIGVKIAEVQFFAEGSAQPLSGAPQANHNLEGTDGDLKTVFTTARNQTHAGIVLAAGKAARLERVRILVAPDNAVELKNVRVLAAPAEAETISVIKTVSANNGQSVSYDYTVITLNGLDDVALVRARYGDGTEARYRYLSDANQGPRALLAEADDPRYSGPPKHIKYDYYPASAGHGTGSIRAEINPKTGVAWAKLEYDSKDAFKRIVRYSDERANTYRLLPDKSGRAAERVDSLGRKTRYEYAGVDDRGRAVAAVDHAGHRLESARDEKGRIAGVKRHGRDSSRTYDERGRMIAARDHLGRETVLKRDQSGRVVQLDQKDGRKWEFSYDTKGRVVRRKGDNKDDTFTYGPTGRLESVTDALGQKVTYGHDKFGRVDRITDAISRITRYERNDRGQITKMIAPDGTSTATVYDGYGRKIAEVDRLGRTVTYAYDELSRVIRQTDVLGRATTFEYAEFPQGCGSCTIAARPTKTTAPDGTVTAMLYDTEGQLLSRTVAQGTPVQATTLFAYDTDGNLTSMTDPLGRVTRYTYDDEHHRLTQTDALGRVTKWTYDDDGNVTKVVAPDGGITKSTYDDAKRLTSTTDAAGNITRFDYDANGRLIATTNAAREVTRFTYDAAGRQLATTYADGKKMTVDYDTANRPAKTTSPDGLVTTTTYDAGDRPLTVTRTAPGKPAEKTAFTYDALGHRLTATDPLGRKTAWTYDARGNVLTVTRPDGIVGTRNTYDAQDNLLTTTDAAGAITTYTYDAARNQTSLTDARGSRYAFTYDALRRKTSMTYPDGSVERWAYDLAGNQVAFTNRAGQTKATAYTAANQPLSEIWTPSPSPLAPSLSPALPQTTTYIYNDDGRLKKVDNGNAKLTYTYDELGRPTSETSDLVALVPGLASHTVGYRYDALGRRSDLVYPDKTKVSYDYDARSRLTTIDNRGGGRTPLATYAYDAQGRIEKLTRDNGVASTYGYDMAGQITDITHKNGGTVLARSAYTLDVLGRRTSQTREDGITETYGYDTTSQLTSADYGAASPLAKAAAPVTRENFSYDALGNRTQVGRVIPNAPSSTTAYTANALNQYSQVAGVPFAYDANGNLTSDGKQSYRYDAQNRLIGVETLPAGGALRPDSVKAEFAYDARNRAVLRKYYSLGAGGQWVLNSNESRALTYDTAWNLLAERSPNGVQVGEYTHGQRVDELLVSNLNSQLLYPLADALGSVVALTDDKGKVTERLRHSAYGQPVNLSASHQVSAASGSGFRFIFTGREWLSKVGLNEHRNRYYVPIIGRWASADPVHHFDGFNIYSYVRNSPCEDSDRFGLCRDSVGMAACIIDTAYNSLIGAIPVVGGLVGVLGININIMQAGIGTGDFIQQDQQLKMASSWVDGLRGQVEFEFNTRGGDTQLAKYDRVAHCLGANSRTARSLLTSLKTFGQFLGPVNTLLSIGDMANDVNGCHNTYCN